MCLSARLAGQQHLPTTAAAATAAAAVNAVAPALCRQLPTGRTRLTQPLCASHAASELPCRARNFSRGVVAAAAAAEHESSTETAAAADSSSMSEITVDDPTSFVDLGIDPLLVAGLAEGGIEVPSPIQEAAIPVLLSGSNAAIQSYTGSGKTLAYLLPALTLALRRAEAAYRRRQAVLARSSSNGRGRVTLREEDMWTVQVLVIAPSQELAMQITRVAQGLFPNDSRTAVQQAIGGANIRRQAESIAEHQPIMVVGTPGRVMDLVGMGVLRLHRCPLLILDEADQLLGDVYARHINTLMEHCGKRLGSSSRSSSSSSSSSSATEPPDSSPQQQQQQQQQLDQNQDQRDEMLQPSKRQTVLVSATLWSGGLARFKPWCPQPEFVTMGASPTWSDEFTDQGSSGPDEAAKTWGWGAKGWEGPASVVQAGPKTQGSVGGPEGQGLVPTLPPQLEHMYIVVNPDRKSDVLRRAVYALQLNMGLGFMNWQQRLKDMAAKMAAKKIEVAALHGELQPMERGAIFEAARNGAYRLLLVSDLAARGIDLPQVDAVFNLELPSSAAHYAHRAGRTGRMGAPGLVITLVAPGERFVVERLSKKLGVPIMECHLAGGRLVVGPQPKRDKKQRPEPEDATDGDTEQQQQAAGSSSSSSAGKKQQREQQREQQQPSQAAAKPLKAAASDSSGITYDPEAAAFDPDEGDDGSLDDESGVFLLDELDDVAVDGDESPEEYRQRLRQEAEAELAEIRQERKQRRQKQPASAAGEGDGEGEESQSRDGSRRVRRSRSGPVPKGTPQEAAALAMAAIEADEAAKKARARLPPELLGAETGSGGSRRSSSGSGGRKLRGSVRSKTSKLR